MPELRWTVTVTDPARAAEWREFLGTDTVPVTGPFPDAGLKPDGSTASFYHLDLEAVDAESVARLVAHLGPKFNLSPAEAEAALREHGVPILSDDVVGPAIPMRFL